MGMQDMEVGLRAGEGDVKQSPLRFDLGVEFGRQVRWDFVRQTRPPRRNSLPTASGRSRQQVRGGFRTEVHRKLCRMRKPDAQNRGAVPIVPIAGIVGPRRLELFNFLSLHDMPHLRKDLRMEFGGNAPHSSSKKSVGWYFANAGLACVLLFAGYEFSEVIRSSNRVAPKALKPISQTKRVRDRNNPPILPLLSLEHRPFVGAKSKPAQSAGVRPTGLMTPVTHWSYGRPFDDMPVMSPQPLPHPWSGSRNQITQVADSNGFEVLPPQMANQLEAPSPNGDPSMWGPQNGWSQSQGAALPPSGPPPQFVPNHPMMRPPGAALIGAEERRLSFQFQSAPWEAVLRYFATQNGMSLQMGQVPPGTFSYFDQAQFTPTEVIDILNDSLLSLGFVLIRSQRHLVVASTKSELPDQMIPFVSSEDLPRLGRHQLASISIPIQAVQAPQAAQEVEKLLSPLGTVKPLSSSRRLLVRDTGSSLRRLWSLLADVPDEALNQTFVVVRLKNTPAEEVARAISEFLSSRPGAAMAPQAAGGHNGQPVPRSNGYAGSQAPIVVAERTTNCLLIRGSASDVAEIQSIVCELDRTPSQVVIQALLVEVELGDTDEFGAELGIQDSVLFNRSVIDKVLTVTETATSPGGNQTTNQKIISQTANPGFHFNNQPLGNNIAASPGTLGSQGLSSLGVGRVNGDLGFGGLVLSASNESISILLRALQARYKTDILSRPQIRTLDNHEAMIQIGRQVPVVDGVAITAVGSANPVVRQDKAGLILKVTPRISPDGMVLIDVNAEKSAYQLAPGTGVPIFTDATNGNVIEAPVKDITTAVTTVSMRTGQTVVLGGMITNDMIHVERKVPLLGDIPYLGALFKYRLDQNTRKELLIFLTPHIIYDEQQSEEHKRVESARINTSWEMAESIHGPIFNPPSASFVPQGSINGRPQVFASPPKNGPAQGMMAAPYEASNPPQPTPNFNPPPVYEQGPPPAASGSHRYQQYGPPQRMDATVSPQSPTPAADLNQQSAKPKRSWMPFASRRAVNDVNRSSTDRSPYAEPSSRVTPASGTRNW